MDVFMVWHVRHAKFLDGSPTEHFGEDGDLKLLGIYATRTDAEGRIERARQQPGFKDEPDCIMIDTLTLGEDQWTDGFVTIPHE